MDRFPRHGDQPAREITRGGAAAGRPDTKSPRKGRFFSFNPLSLPKITSAKAAHPGRTERIRPAPGLLRRRRAKHSSMDITLSIAAFVLSILGIIGCIVPALPGVVLSYAGLLCAWFTSYSHMTSGAIWLWLAVTVAVSVADYFLPAWMTRRFGGSRSGAIGATVGVFAGFFLFPPVGIILGPFVGAVLGELLNDRGDVPEGFPRGIRVVPRVRRRHGRQAGGLGRHADPRHGRHLPRSPGLVRNYFLKHIAYEKVSTTNSGHPRGARFVLQQIQVRNGVERSAENPDLHAPQRPEGLHERHEGAAPHPDGHRRAGRRQERPLPRRPAWHTTSNT